jgi:UDP-glucuronate decarboxylase
VDDLIEGLVRLMDSDDAVTGPINLGRPGEFTILALAEKILELSGSSSEIIFKELPVDDPRQRKPDITLARDILIWEPEVELEEGLKKTIAYFDEILKK